MTKLLVNTYVESEKKTIANTNVNIWHGEDVPMNQLYNKR